MDRPSIILITTDQQRFDGLSINGNPILRTPVMDHMAATGMNFTRGYTTCPSCIAARRTILTGLHPSNPTHGLPGYQDGLQFDPPWTVGGQLKKVGYLTQLIGKLHQYPQRKRFGFDHMILSEQMEYRPDSPYFSQNDYATWLAEQGEPHNPAANGIGANSWVARPWHLHEDLHQTSYLVEKAIEFIRFKRDPSCPFFLHLSFWAPHPPLVPPQAYWDRYIGRTDWSPHVGSWVPQFRGSPRGLPTDASVGPYDPRQMQQAMAGYYGMINHIDDRIQYLFKQVFERSTPLAGMPTWILYTSDHGEMLGDHQLYRKTLPYEGSAHVPFFVTGKNVDLPKTHSSDALVCLEDLLPTICDLAGAETPNGVDGRSLAPVLRGQSGSVRDELFGEHSGGLGNHWLVAGRYKYCWFTRFNEEQVFDLADDPWETRDLSGDASILRPLRERMADHLAGRDDFDYDVAKLTPLNNRPPRAFWDKSLPDVRPPA